MQIKGEGQVVFLRWALIASLAYMLLIRDDGHPPSSLELGYVGLLLGSNLLIPRIPYRNPRAFGSILLAIDSAFVLIGLILCSSTSQDLLIGYFLCIIMAAFGDSERRIAGAATLVTTAYAVWIYQNWGPTTQSSMLIRLPFLFVTTAFYGFMMLRVRSENARRLRAESHARSLDRLLQITRSFSSSLATAEVLQRVADTIQETLSVGSCRIRLLSEMGVSPIEPVVVEALERREPVLRAEAELVGARCHLALPIVFDVELLGVMVVDAFRGEGAFCDEEVSFCQVVANAAAPALKNSIQYERLAELENTKAEFLSNLSHELRTPLSAILGYSELASDSLGADDGFVAEIVGNISRSASEMTRHVESLLQLSQLTLGREHPNVDRVDVGELLAHLVDSARGLLTRHEVELGLQVEPGLPEVYADGKKLERIVQQILLNAVKFTESGSIRVAAALVDGAQGVRLSRAVQPWEKILSVRVEDSGIGISAEHLGHVFGEFRQGDGSATRKYPGLGIGLTLCRRLAEVLGGGVEVRSQPGKGSVFEVLLPVQTECGAEKAFAA